MQIFTINLARRPDRLVAIATNLYKFDLRFERLDAVDMRGNNIALAYHRPILAFIFGNRSYAPGQIGCYLSHRKIWQKMVDENISQALVLEDDAEIDNWDPRILDVSVRQLGFDVLRIGANAAASELNMLDYKKLDGKILERELVTGKLWGTVASIVTLEAAQKYLKLNKYWFPMDHFHAYEKTIGLKSAITSPLFFLPHESESDISVTKKPLTKLQSTILIVTKRLRWHIFYPLLFLFIKTCVKLKIPIV